MSVLVKGMDMPEDCDSCPFFDDGTDYPTCNATGHSRGYNWNPRGQVMPDCPLEEVIAEVAIQHVESTPEMMGYDK